MARAKEQQRREEVAKKKAAEDAKERAEVAKKEAEETAKKEAEDKVKKEAEEKAKKEAEARNPSASNAPVSTGAASEDNKRSSQQHYLSGVIFFQKGDFDKARDEWNLSIQLDPSNSDAKAGLERIEKLFSGGQ